MPHQFGYYIFGYLEGASHPRLLCSAEVNREGTWPYIRTRYAEAVSSGLWTGVAVLVMGSDFKMGRVDKRWLE